MLPRPISTHCSHELRSPLKTTIFRLTDKISGKKPQFTWNETSSYNQEEKEDDKKKGRQERERISEKRTDLFVNLAVPALHGMGSPDDREEEMGTPGD